MKIGDDKLGRVGSLIAFNDQGHTVGLITNKLYPLALNYDEATDTLFTWLHQSHFDVQILRIEKKHRTSERHYFTAKIIHDSRTERNGQ